MLNPFGQVRGRRRARGRHHDANPLAQPTLRFHQRPVLRMRFQVPLELAGLRLVEFAIAVQADQFGYRSITHQYYATRSSQPPADALIHPGLALEH